MEGVKLYTVYGPWIVVPPTPAPGYGPSAITDANGYYHVDGQVRNHPEYFQVWPYLEGYTFVPNIEHFHYYNFPDPPVELTASFTAHPVSD